MSYGLVVAAKYLLPDTLCFRASHPSRSHSTIWNTWAFPEAYNLLELCRGDGHVLVCKTSD